MLYDTYLEYIEVIESLAPLDALYPLSAQYQIGPQVSPLTRSRKAPFDPFNPCLNSGQTAGLYVHRPRSKCIAISRQFTGLFFRSPLFFPV